MINETQADVYIHRINKLLNGEQVLSYDLWNFPYDNDELMREGNGEFMFTIESIRQPIRDAIVHADIMCKDLAYLVVDMI